MYCGNVDKEVDHNIEPGKLGSHTFGVCYCKDHLISILGLFGLSNKIWNFVEMHGLPLRT